MLRFYGYKKCDTCRKAEKWLGAKGIDYEFVDITEKAPSVKELSDALQSGTIEMKSLFNTSGLAYKEGNFKDKVKSLTEKEAIKVLAENGRLVKRPFITDGKRFLIGFKDELFQKSWLKKKT